MLARRVPEQDFGASATTGMQFLPGSTILLSSLPMQGLAAPQITFTMCDSQESVRRSEELCPVSRAVGGCGTGVFRRYYGPADFGQQRAWRSSMAFYEADPTARDVHAAWDPSSYKSSVA